MALKQRHKTAGMATNNITRGWNCDSVIQIQIRKYNKKMSTTTWLPPHTKRQVLKLRLGTYVPPPPQPGPQTQYIAALLNIPKLFISELICVLWQINFQLNWRIWVWVWKWSLALGFPYNFGLQCIKLVIAVHNCKILDSSAKIGL